MPVVPTRDILARAFAERYGVAAINIINDLTMDAVLAAAEELKAPIIVQTSPKTVKQTGLGVIYAMWVEMARSTTVPVAFHLDHCPDRDVISACLAKGWSSVLFDASKLSVEENKRQCIEVVAEARRSAPTSRARRGVQAHRGHDRRRGAARPVPRRRRRLRARDRGRHLRPGDRQRPRHVQDRPDAHLQRVTDIVEATGKPVALHGGTGMAPDQFSDLIARGCAKVNISTALKIVYMQSGYDFMTEHPGDYDPPRSSPPSTRP